MELARSARDETPYRAKLSPSSVAAIASSVFARSESRASRAGFSVSDAEPIEMRAGAEARRTERRMERRTGRRRAGPMLRAEVEASRGGRRAGRGATGGREGSGVPGIWRSYGRAYSTLDGAGGGDVLPAHAVRQAAVPCSVPGAEFQVWFEDVAAAVRAAVRCAFVMSWEIQVYGNGCNSAGRERYGPVVRIVTVSHSTGWLPWTALARADRMLSMLTPHRQLVVPALLIILAACANGTDELMPGYYEEQAGGGGSGGGGGEGGAGGVDASSSSRASSSVSSSSAGVGGAGGEGGSSDGGGGEGGATGECDYGSPNTCAGAEDLGEISGDDGGDELTVTGTTSKWFKIKIVDLDDEASSEHFRATLRSPPGMNFDLIVYEGGLDAPDCFASGVRGQGTPESFYATWDDFPILDDHRWFSLEVRHVDGTTCGDDAAWTLTVSGNNAALP
ncbi:hypothetical protein [Sorangium sp. So ce394]|uniref:hypothetical protein n=1 Tax=Sorangium sp. So ce394 TaxID=3133310 RepID=UPI003F5C41C5